MAFYRWGLMPRNLDHEQALARCDLFVAAALGAVAAQLGCTPEDLDVTLVRVIQTQVLGAFHEGFEYAHERTTGKTPPPFPAVKVPE